MATPYSRYLIGTLPWYSVLMVTGIFVAYLIGTREERRLGLPQDSMLDMVLVAVPSGIIGARLYYVLMSWEQFAANPVSILFIWEGGIAIYGSILGGGLGVWLYCRLRGRSFAALLDIAAPGLALAQAIGRVGNYFNQEAFGPAITVPAWQFFPAGVFIAQGASPGWHVATFFYESMWNLGVFGTLWLVRKRLKRRGDVFLWYLVLYGSGRFLVEQLREDSLYLFGVRASQYLALLTCVAVAVVFLWRLSRERKPQALVASALAAALAFARPLLAGQMVGAISTVLAYAACAAFLLRWPGRPAWALWWLIADMLLYGALLLLGLVNLWHSPYFLYAGLSIPPYLAIAYQSLAGTPAQAALQEE